MLDADEIMKDLQGFDMTTSPASNAGDPLSRHVSQSNYDSGEFFERQIDELFDVSDDKPEDKQIATISVGSSFEEVNNISKEAMKDLDEIIGFYKSDESYSDLIDIINKAS